MTPEERKEKLDSIAGGLFEISRELEAVLPGMALEKDQQVVRSIVSELQWATEHCTTIGLHQTGLALNDKCGFD